MAELTEEQRETLSDCADCMAALCSVCGHEPCPVCADDCDHPDCIEWNADGSGTKTHACVLARCPLHAELGKGISKMGWGLLFATLGFPKTHGRLWLALFTLTVLAYAWGRFL